MKNDPETIYVNDEVSFYCHAFPKLPPDTEISWEYNVRKTTIHPLFTEIYSPDTIIELPSSRIISS